MRFSLPPLFLFLHIIVPAQQACFPIWQGFSQTWGYNHRVNRLGDWTVQTGLKGECRAELSHAAASGSGSDRADFVQYYAWVESNLVHADDGITTFYMEGKEGEFITAAENFSHPLPAAGDSNAHVEVVLQGFDLYTAEGAKADKIQSLDIAVDTVWRDIPGSTVWFRVKVAMRFSCSSLECEALNQIVDYHLRVHWTVLAGQGFHSVRSTYGSSRAWEKNDTASAPPIGKVALLGDAHYPQATAGITGLHMQLDREQHMRGWESRIQCFDYANGLLMLGLRMDFEQHHPGMYAAFRERFTGGLRPPARWVVKRRAGNMVWEMDVALLQFEDAVVGSHRREGSIAWKTGHRAQPSAAGREAVNVVTRGH